MIHVLPYENIAGEVATDNYYDLIQEYFSDAYRPVSRGSDFKLKGEI